MINVKTIGLCNLHDAPELGELTSTRNPASLSFLGRYALIDVPLSNFVNSGIDIVGILVKDKFNSILGHLGNRMAWIENTKIGKERIMFNENGLTGKVENTDIQNILNTNWLLYSNCDYVVVAPAHVIMNINYKSIVKQHAHSKADITMIYYHNTDAKNTFVHQPIVTVDNDKIVSINKNRADKNVADVCLGSYVMNKSTMDEIIAKKQKDNKPYSLIECISEMLKENLISINAYEYVGYVRCIDSMEHYKDYSLEVLHKDIADQIFNSNWPYYTLTHDTQPAKYGKNCSIKNSYIANGAIIDGSVKNCIISRNVKIETGAVIVDSLILTETTIKKGAHLENVIIDKYNVVEENAEFIGTKEKPLYKTKG